MPVLTRSVGYKQPSIRHTHTHQGTLARQTHLSLLNPFPIPYFSLRLCTELCSIQSGLRSPWRFFSFIYCWQSTPTESSINVIGEFLPMTSVKASSFEAIDSLKPVFICWK
ncbi:unnamed protein product [Hymenolepis diminuta]|uniref:Uncharacterized protein n=1 Tax=Hymenolepis diminuta TaxID=6216 RepID=A0A564Z7G9_HYMDI|nr:unnamed protein product [Hymenolepis diminuta]